MKKTSPKLNAKRPAFRYVVRVVENIEYLTAVESDKQLPWCRIKEEVERRRIAGDLSFNGVKDVDMWVCDAYVDGKEILRTQSDRKRK